MPSQNTATTSQSPPSQQQRTGIAQNNSRGESSQSFSTGEGAIFANRTNSDFKWQRSKMVVGALEVKSEPDFNPRADMVPRYKDGMNDTFEEALQAWQDLKLRQSFIAACEELEAEACCCGMVHDADASIKEYVKLLNDKWVKTANKKLQSRAVKIDMFLWNWQNASGKAETNIMLIRFHELSTYKFRRASNQGSLDLDDMLNEGDEAIEDLDQSHRGTTEKESSGDSLGAVKTQEMAR